MIKEGDKAPNFTLENEVGESITLSDFYGKRVVLYFYSKDNTSGCTKEACSFRDVYDDMLDAGAVVIGISKDSVSSHDKFKKKHGLPFYLLSDPEHTVMESYGVWQEKNMYGKKTMGTKRSTFIIDESGTIIKIFDKVKTEVHGEDVLKFLLQI